MAVSLASFDYKSLEIERNIKKSIAEFEKIQLLNRPFKKPFKRPKLDIKKEYDEMSRFLRGY